MQTTATSIAVLPFESLSPDADTAYFARGFAEDLITNLSRFTTLRVVASQTSFAMGGADGATGNRAREFGVQYLLTGSVRVRGDLLRASARLLRVDGEETVWADRFDAPLDDVFVVQDEITATVAGRLAARIQDQHLARARRLSSSELAAYDLWLRGMDCLQRATLEGDEEARASFRKALDIDPDFARAHAGMSVSHFNEWSCQAWHLWDESSDSAFDHALRAATIDDADAVVQAVLARVYRYRREHVQADAHAERALDLNPNDAYVQIQIALATLFRGEPDRARELAERAMQCNPLHPPWYEGTVGWCHFIAGRPEEALPLLVLGGDTIVNFGAYRAACHALAGRLEEARRELAHFEREYREKIAFGRSPLRNEALRWAVQVEPFQRIEDSRRMPDALRDAGLADLDVGDALRSRPSKMVRPADIERPRGNTFRGADGVWTFDYEGAGARLVELKGFHDIARLLAAPDAPIHCLELVGAPRETRTRQDVLDEDARRSYRRRIEELQQDLDRAEGDHDPARAEPLRKELDALVDELVRASGLGGRVRVLGSTAERARSTVTWRIRSAIKKIRAAHPRLGQHLANSVRTGTFCIYAPEAPTNWAL